MRRCLLTLLLLLFTLPSFATIRVGSLNAYHLFHPSGESKRRLAEGPENEEIYGQKLCNLASLTTKVDVVGLQEVGSAQELGDLARQANMTPVFVAGKDTYTGQDVAVLLHPGVQLIAAGRDPRLERLSKHLVVNIQKEGEAYTLLVVHLLRPTPKQEQKRELQVKAIQQWLAEQTNAVIILGDFNAEGPDLSPLVHLNQLLGYPETHVGHKGIDHIFANGKFIDGGVIRPPYAKRPNDIQRMLWTDHYFIWGELE